MKQITYLPIILLFFVFITSSCRSKSSTIEENSNSPSVNMPSNNSGNIQSIPEVPAPSEVPPPSDLPSETTTPVQQPPEQPPSTNRNVEAPKKVTQKRTPLGSYKTPLLSKAKNRVDNIKLASKKINGYKVKPGAIFSFNDVVGKRDAENGFKVATIIVKGEYDEDMGGGVCQLSSTLYNAADKAKLEVLERHAHSRAVSYLPEGRDAAVSYGYLDLKFKNNKEYSIEIRAWVESNEVHVAIYKAK